ncbi:hypothetical protein ACIQPT_19380 [Streptomyces sp. NPDC091289]|uniref:hypothetical protein n=1 Tax=Streptomyces sp. NPDC091289 TaxID=3365989 RepID=UPI003810C829
MTGKPAGSKPTGTGPVRLADEQSRAFEHVVKAYAAPESGAEKMPSGIRRNMAHAITYYRDDVYEIVSGQVDYSDPRFSTEPNDIDVSRPVMWAFLKGVARDKAAFGLVRESMFDLIEQQVNELQREDFAGEQRGDSDQAIGVARQSGRTVGVLQASRFEGLQGQFGESGAKLEEALADKDYQAYGVPRLGQLFRSRAASLGIRETPESQRRLDDIVSTAEDNYRMRSGFLVP